MFNTRFRTRSLQKHQKITLDKFYLSGVFTSQDSRAIIYLVFSANFSWFVKALIKGMASFWVSMIFPALLQVWTTKSLCFEWNSTAFTLKSCFQFGLLILGSAGWACKSSVRRTIKEKHENHLIKLSIRYLCCLLLFQISDIDQTHFWKCKHKNISKWLDSKIENVQNVTNIDIVSTLPLLIYFILFVKAQLFLHVLISKPCVVVWVHWCVTNL